MQMLPLVRPVGAVSGGILDRGSEGERIAQTLTVIKGNMALGCRFFPKGEITEKTPVTGKGI